MRFLLGFLIFTGSLFGMEGSPQDLFLRVIREGNVERVRKLILGTDPDHFQVSPVLYHHNEPLVTALGIQDFSQRFEMVKLLLEKGVDPNVKQNEGITREGESLLACVGRKGWIREVVLLLVYGANPNATNIYNDTVLHSCLNEYGELPFAKAYNATGEDFDAKAQYLRSVIFSLLRFGADPSQKNNFQHSVNDLMWDLDDDDDMDAMVADFKRYCANTENAKLFKELDLWLQEQQLQRELKQKIQYFGLFNALHGIKDPKLTGPTALERFKGPNALRELAQKRKRADW